jgi:hypothetical protein
LYAAGACPEIGITATAIKAAAAHAAIVTPTNRLRICTVSSEHTNQWVQAELLAFYNAGFDRTFK